MRKSQEHLSTFEGDSRRDDELAASGVYANAAEKGRSYVMVTLAALAPTTWAEMASMMEPDRMRE